MAKAATPSHIAFHARYVIRESGCWEWTGQKDKDGYGIWQVSRAPRVRMRANRLAWEIFKGAIPDQLHVLHSCDNFSCVNPEHLFLGTHLENMQDRDQKGRVARGERQGGARLTETNVREIMASQKPTTYFAEKFGVSFQTVGDIRQGRTWRHLGLQRSDNPGANRASSGSKNGMAILNEGKVRRIKRLLRQGNSCASIGREYGVSGGLIELIKHGKTWRHVK